PDQLLAFSRKHGADHNFDPAHIALDDVHRLLLTKFPSPLLAPNGPSLIIAQPRPRGTSSRYKKGQRRRPQLPEMPPSGLIRPLDRTPQAPCPSRIPTAPANRSM